MIGRTILEPGDRAPRAIRRPPAWLNIALDDDAILVLARARREGATVRVVLEAGPERRVLLTEPHADAYQYTP